MIGHNYSGQRYERALARAAGGISRAGKIYLPAYSGADAATRHKMAATSPAIERGAAGTCQYLMRIDGRQKECGCPAAYKGRARPFLLYCKAHGEFVSRSFEVVALDGSGTSLKPWRVNGRNPSAL